MLEKLRSEIRTYQAAHGRVPNVLVLGLEEYNALIAEGSHSVVDEVDGIPLAIDSEFLWSTINATKR